MQLIKQNLQTWLLQVKIKRKFALVLDASEIQDMKTAEFIEREQKRFGDSF